MPLSNDCLCDWASTAVNAYAQATGDPYGLTEEGDAECLLASLIHLADKRGWNFLTMLARAISVHNMEVEEVEYDRTAEEVALEA